jgi:hypothetical protein
MSALTIADAPSPARARAGATIGWFLLALALAYGTWRAVQFFWCSDDAFISFRYAKNFNAGLGLVFNAGQRVEGYTNFSWTMLVAAAMRLGADPVVFTQLAGLACYLATIAVLAFASSRFLPPGSPFVPVAAIGFALHEHGQVFASGGLETSLFTLLATSTVCVACAARRDRGLLWAGLLGVLAAMTRPDGALLYGSAGLVALVRAARARRLAPLLWVAAPALLVFLPYWLWRSLYYGWPFPNTFYAKSAASPYPQQGLYYIGLYLGCYFVLLLSPLGLLVGATRASTRGLALTIAATLALYLTFVGWVGGDFMFGRFLVPITPLAYLGLELLRVRWPSAGPSALVLALTVLGTLLSRYPSAAITRLPGGERGVVEERLNYTPGSTAAMRGAGEQLRALFAEHDVRVVITGAQAIWAYYGEFALAIEGCTGLTDEYIAHLPVRERAAIGHEKSILTLDPDYLVRERVHFHLHLDYSNRLPGHYRSARFGTVLATVVTYDRALMRSLAGKPDVEVVDFEAHLDRYLAGLPQQSDAAVHAAWTEFEAFYFRHNPDPERERPFRARLPLLPNR